MVPVFPVSLLWNLYSLFFLHLCSCLTCVFSSNYVVWYLLNVPTVLGVFWYFIDKLHLICVSWVRPSTSWPKRMTKRPRTDPWRRETTFTLLSKRFVRFCCANVLQSSAETTFDVSSQCSVLCCRQDWCCVSASSAAAMVVCSRGNTACSIHSRVCPSGFSLLPESRDHHLQSCSVAREPRTCPWTHLCLSVRCLQQLCCSPQWSWFLQQSPLPWSRHGCPRLRFKFLGSGLFHVFFFSLLRLISFYLFWDCFCWPRHAVFFCVCVFQTSLVFPVFPPQPRVVQVLWSP